MEARLYLADRQDHPGITIHRSKQEPAEPELPQPTTARQRKDKQLPAERILQLPLRHVLVPVQNVPLRHHGRLHNANALRLRLASVILHPHQHAKLIVPHQVIPEEVEVEAEAAEEGLVVHLEEGTSHEI